MATTEAPDGLFTLGDLITMARKKAGMSQDELAEAIGRVRKTISRWENGPAEPRPRDLRKIATATDAKWLLNDVSDLLTRMPEWVTADEVVRAVAA